MTAGPLAVTILGPSGRMGRALLAAAGTRDDVRVAAALDRTDAPAIDHEVAPGVRATALIDAALAAAPVYIDFTTPAATTAIARAARARRIAAVVGTTGLDAEAEAALAALAEVAPVVGAPNFSVGVNLLIGLVGRAARALDASWDAEIVELHHRAKRDAPSGTALGIARAIAAARGQELAAVGRYARAGDIGARPAGEIGAVAVRGGDVVGEHTAYFFGAGERLELTHRATDRAIFAHGALRAARWVVQQPPGRYDMLDVLGMR
ncbi:MAG TPA: 4-hydroxy-tetrahydrodipicolinate reductase [Kofleriaceae bacterium]|nr:4-hydroxy-tetrahydrodipicolinate reductase [Kofleriaceae bacterium]